MPLPLPLTVCENKNILISVFKSYLLASKYGYTLDSQINKDLIRDVIEHRSFGAAFTHEIRGSKMKTSNISTAICKLTDDILDYLQRPPVSSQCDYDDWHKKTGENFLNNCSGYKEFQFGKAQKIINVTMKHLYCYDVSEDYFKYCHIALDSMTYTGNSANSLDGGFYKCEVHPCAAVKPFSNLSYNEYIGIQKEMRDYLDCKAHDYKDTATGVNLTPFKAEFYIWPRYKR